MENKLQELTQKLYNEGLSKGREQADTLIADAEKKAAEIIAAAESKAQKIADDAKKLAEETAKNTATEIALASSQSVATLKDAITTMVIEDAFADSVKAACIDAAFVQKLLLAVAGAWNGTSSDKADLMAELPEAKQAEFEKGFKASAKKFLDAGVELTYSSGVKSGFKISPKAGGYYISFTDDDFKALLSEFIRPRVAKILF